MTGNDLVTRAGVAALALIALAFLVSCDAPSDCAAAFSPIPGAITQSDALSPSDALSQSDALSKDEIVERARNDLALKRLALFQEPSVLGVETVRLPSGSLGCPSSLPWVSYPSDFEWGYRILLGLGGEVYEYRASADGRVVTCGQAKPLAEASEITPTPTPTADRFVEAARRSLSAELRLDLSEIVLVDAQPGRWGDFSLDCPQGGRSYPPIEATGYSIWLRARGQAYELRVNSLTGAVEYCARDVPPTPTATPPPIREPIQGEPIQGPTSAPAPQAIPLSGGSLDRVLAEVAAERNVSVGDVHVESVEPAETSRYAAQCRGNAGVTNLRGSIAELSVPGGVLAVYLDPDGSFVSCGR